MWAVVTLTHDARIGLPTYIHWFVYPQALGALPYIVALDHDTKSVVVSIRGSVSTADWVTDFLGIPEQLEDWLPDAFKRVCVLAILWLGCTASLAAA